ncbi:protein adenylyltransferase SelO [Nonlabens sp.]|uniref:protein adenylyltransferase SelO n=1 Tax=Nonlabens sp. TaxID=1888209 RepID=UPI003F69BF6A
MHKLPINNSFTNTLPEDPIQENFTRQVSDVAYSIATPLKFEKASLIHVSQLAEELGFDVQEIKEEEFLKLFTGQVLYPNTQSYAMAYAGHQFGNWAGQLGDGRAINLFEILEKDKRWAFQLKGAGPTPYSRRGDGLAVLRSSVREHLCSEAMHHLGVPTTRSLSLSLSGDQVLRDVMYDGHPDYEKGAIVCRVAPSFIRFGNFELAAAQGDNDLLKKLADYTLSTFFTDIKTTGKEAYLQLFQEVTDRTLEMILHWQRVGFVHGVMNTDNMSILGLTIDYGPYGWLEPYDHGWTPNTTDRQNKRYRYGAQPEIGLWNLLQLANALFPLVEDAVPLQKILDSYKINYQVQYLETMMNKLGIYHTHKDDRDLIQTLEENLHLHETDMTIFYRELSKIDHKTAQNDAFKIISIAFYHIDQLTEARKNSWIAWLESYVLRLELDVKMETGNALAFAKARTEKMNATNPKYVLRNYIAQLVIDEADKGDYQLLNDIYTMLQKPYEEQPEYDKWYALRPEWARDKVGCSMLSCSS